MRIRGSAELKGGLKNTLKFAMDDMNTKWVILEFHFNPINNGAAFASNFGKSDVTLIFKAHDSSTGFKLEERFEIGRVRLKFEAIKLARKYAKEEGLYKRFTELVKRLN